MKKIIFIIFCLGILVISNNVNAIPNSGGITCNYKASFDDVCVVDIKIEATANTGDFVYVESYIDKELSESHCLGTNPFGTNIEIFGLGDSYSPTVISPYKNEYFVNSNNEWYCPNINYRIANGAISSMQLSAYFSTTLSEGYLNASSYNNVVDEPTEEKFHVCNTVYNFTLKEGGTIFVRAKIDTDNDYLQFYQVTKENQDQSIYDYRTIINWTEPTCPPAEELHLCATDIPDVCPPAFIAHSEDDIDTNLLCLRKKNEYFPNEYLDCEMDHYSTVQSSPFIYFEFNPDDIIGSYQDCAGLLGSSTTEGDPAYYLQLVLEIMRYVAIIALVILTIIDIIQSVIAQDDDALKKSFGKITRRLVYCIIIFLFPFVLEFIFEIAGIYGIDTCEIDVL